MPGSLSLRPHQQVAMESMHNGSILRGGVGSGKSRTAIGYYWYIVCGANEEGILRDPRDILIITPAKKRNDLEWWHELSHIGISHNRDDSVGNVQVYVDSWQNIGRYVDRKGYFVIFDEQRLVGSGAWVKAFYKIAAENQWVVLSATPGDVWMDYVPIFVANGFYKNRAEFIRTHCVYENFSGYPKLKRYVEVARLEALREKIIVDMPFERHTTRHVVQLTVNHDRELYKRVMKDRWNPYTEEPVENVSELFYTVRKVVNNDISRVEELDKVFQKHPRLIIFYNFTYELERLREWSAGLTGVETAEYNGQKHEKLPTGDSWLYLVQYTAGSDAWNCTTTDAIVFYSQNYSYKVLEQSMGRIDRMNTEYTDLYYYIIRSNSQIDGSIAKALAAKKDFNERAYAKKVEFDVKADNVLDKLSFD